MVSGNFDPKIEHLKLEDKVKKINENIDVLKETKENIFKYFKTHYKNEIKELINSIKVIEDQNLSEYEEGSLAKLIEKCQGEDIKDKVNYIKDVKNFLLFNIIYDDISSLNEEAKYKEAQKELESIKNLIKKKDIANFYNQKKVYINLIISKLRKKEKDSNEFIEKLKHFCGIKDEEKNLIKDLIILFKIEKYKFDIDSMIFFFECLRKKMKIGKKKNGLKN